MRKLTTMILVCVLWISCLSVNAATCNGNYLSANGNKLYDSNGSVVQLTGVNWFGFETSMGFFHGIWTRDHKSVLQQIKDLGFNCIRIPWNNAILTQNIAGQINAYGTDPYTGVSPMNAVESQATSPLEILDIAIQWCQDNNMKVILDNHSREPDGYLNEALWYTANVSHEKWIEDWVFITNRYKNFDAVIGMDINNEPHGAYGGGSRWGTGNPANDWRLAAQECGNAILAANPNVLIFVEGTEEFEQTSYWWGGNLQGARDYPVVLNKPEKLVYSPHEYGPTVHNQTWFSDPTFPANMPGIWEANFNYLHTNGTSPLFVGEFGIKDQGGTDEIWFDTFLQFMGEKGYSWTFWCLNPNSGDTGGLLDDQWSNIVTWKMNKLTPYLAPEIPNCSGTTNPIPVTGVSVTPTTATLTTAGATQTLTATVSPVNATNKSVTWSSNNTSAATVSSNGIVTAVANGTATITITTVDGLFTATSAITVDISTTTIPVTGVTISPTALPLTVGNTGSLTATVAPANATNKTVSWSSNNTAVASVNSSGVVTAVAVGSSTITVTTQDGSFTATSSVTVTTGTSIGCSNPVAISIPFSKDGAGEFCWETSLEPGFVNSWNLETLTINGDDYTNIWSNSMPPAQGGKWVIHYIGNFGWSHFEIPEAKSAITSSEKQTSINIYPVPFEDELLVELSDFGQVLNIELYSSTGQLIQVLDRNQISSTTRLKVIAPNGLYILRVNTINESIVKSVLKK